MNHKDLYTHRAAVASSCLVTHAMPASCCVSVIRFEHCTALGINHLATVLMLVHLTVQRFSHFYVTKL